MPKTLLLADDSVVIQKLVGLSFANEDVELVTTDNGDDAITKARECKPDVVLADVVMPGRSGYEVCEAIKADPELAHVPVILLTGTFEAFDESRANSAGSSGHITKPFEAQALVERVNDLLRETAAAAAPVATPELEVFDGGAASNDKAGQGHDAPRGHDASFGHDVTTAAEPALGAPAVDASPLAPPLPPAMPDPLSAGGGFDANAGGAGLPPLTDSDPLAAPFDLADTPAPGGEHTIAMMPEVAEDDLLATSSGGSPTVTSMPFESPDATPPLEDPLDVSSAVGMGSDPLGDPGSMDSSPSLSGSGDPSLTTIIMSEGDSSSDDISLGEPITPVRSLDDVSSEPLVEVPSGSATMMADDLFSEPIATEDSDSGFDFGTADVSFSGGEPLSQPVEAAPLHDTMLGDDPLAMPPSAMERGGAPELASQYDVSSSELIDPVDAAPDDASNPAFGGPLEHAAEFPVADDPVFAPTVAEDEIALTDGLLGEPIRVDDPMAAPEPLHTPVVPAPSDTDGAYSGVQTASGPDITPVMRDRIHDTLERVAWEALADLNETLIKQVVERVEAIAWEVIPQMAEALVKEEIRRMKGDDE